MCWAFHLSAGTMKNGETLKMELDRYFWRCSANYESDLTMVKAATISLLPFLSTAASFALQNDTEVKVVYAYHTTSDANSGLTKHTNTGILSGKHNLILMAMSAVQPSSTAPGMQPSSTVSGMQPSSTAPGMQPSSTVSGMQPSSTVSVPSTMTPLSYNAVVSSPDGFFKLQWTYNNRKLIFKMTCKTTGWCAVGFTATADGKNMVNYDIAVAGYASGAGYIDVSK